MEVSHDILNLKWGYNQEECIHIYLELGEVKAQRHLVLRDTCTMITIEAIKNRWILKSVKGRRHSGQGMTKKSNLPQR
jgi:hypothetical protein